MFWGKVKSVVALTEEEAPPFRAGRFTGRKQREKVNEALVGVQIGCTFAVRHQRRTLGVWCGEKLSTITCSRCSGG